MPGVLFFGERRKLARSGGKRQYVENSRGVDRRSGPPADSPRRNAMPRPNWFFAFPIDGRFVLDLPAPPPALRPFHPDDVHLTLAFLGGCGEEAALAALAALDERLK